MMPRGNTGLAALAGIFRGFEGFPKGLQAGFELRQRDQAQEALERERQEARAFQQEQATATGEERLAARQFQEKQLGALERHRQVLEAAPEKTAQREREQMARLQEAMGLAFRQPAEHETGTEFDPSRPETRLRALAPHIPRTSVGGLLEKTLFPKEPKEPDLGARREARIQQTLREEGYEPGDPGYAKEFLGLEYPLTPVEGRGAFPRPTDIPPGPRHPSRLGKPSGVAPVLAEGAQPRIPVDKPLSAEQARQLSSTEQVKHALDTIGEAIQAPEINQYLGPISQHRSSLERGAAELGKLGVPGLEGATGPPPAVVDLEQNLKIMGTEVRRLATGAQMSRYEAEDILGQLPRQDRHQLPEFKQRYATTVHNMEVLRRMAQAGLTKQQWLRMKSMLIGLRSPAEYRALERQGVAPTAPTQPKPSGLGGWKIERVP